MKFNQYLNESEKDLVMDISNIIDDFTDDVGCDISNNKQCHESVNKVKTKGQDLMVGRFSFYKSLKFIEWNESKWNKMMDYIKKDKSHKRIKVNTFQDLVEDIGDGTVNGHSFIKYKKWYIDPYLSSANVSFNDIQKIDRWFEKAYNEV